jgi:hypothetical protein
MESIYVIMTIEKPLDLSLTQQKYGCEWLSW